MRVLLIGAGPVGLEKLQALVTQSPETAITVVAREVSDAFADFAAENPQVNAITAEYDASYLRDADIVLVAVNDIDLASQIRDDAKAVGKLVNVADTPDLCDFYLSSIVKKGNLKIAISTNGKSPTMAKRLKEVLNDSLPAGLEESLDNLNQVRNKLNGDFQAKVDKLNAITRVLVDEDQADEPAEKQEKKWKKIANWCLFAILFMFAGHALFSLIPYDSVREGFIALSGQFDEKFWWMLAAGFCAQLVDGALGMGYGVISTVTLLSAGVNLAAISGSVHTAEMFSSGASGYSHYKFGNVNKKLFKALLIPGVLGSIAGAIVLYYLGEKNAAWARPILSAYTLILGIRIFMNAFRKNTVQKKVKRVGWLAGAGGFLDSFGGGGWGPLVTSTLIFKGRSPRYVIGSVSLTEFFVTLASAATFFIL
ncbi:MAG: TSUP family transporter, partial [Mucilaginibacter polytrichastri]|nr:TSUP family transporter [Mucilaginibacter polytrichastri]